MKLHFGALEVTCHVATVSWLYSASKERGGTQNEMVGFRYCLEETSLMAQP